MTVFKNKRKAKKGNFLVGTHGGITTFSQLKRGRQVIIQTVIPSYLLIEGHTFRTWKDFCDSLSGHSVCFDYILQAQKEYHEARMK